MELQQRPDKSWEQLHDELENGLTSILETDFVETIKARMCMELCLRYCNSLRAAQLSFDTVSQEINYFREVKPRIHARYIFYAELYHILLSNFSVSPEVEVNYYRKHLLRLKVFLERHGQFYQYYRSGLNYLDDSYFTRHKDNDEPPLLEFIDFDRVQSTGYDYLLAKIIAYEMLCQDLNRRIAHLKHPEPVTPQKLPRFILNWTAPKVAMAELIYALYASGVFNHSQVDIKQIVDAFSHIFNLPLNNIYKVWEEIRLRQKNRTSFLDNLRANLIRKMDEDDLAAK